MANEKHVALLKQGVEVWNKWREQNLNIVPNLSAADLGGANLEGARLGGTDLRDTNFRGANLEGADLGRANLYRADLRDTNLRDADLGHANLGGAKLGHAKLGHAKLSDADLSHAELYGANLGRANLYRADLGYAYLEDANLDHAHLSGANLGYANLDSVKLGHAKLVGAKLGYANLGGAELSDADLSRADLYGAKLNHADLGGAKLGAADLGGARLRGANLYRAKLRGAKLRGANLRGAKLGHANLAKTDFSGTDLREATLIDSRLDGADLTGAKLWETQRGGWSIKGVICRRAFWDRDGEEPTEYKDGEFERVFAEKPRIVLRYPGSMLPVDLAMLPLIVERLQAEHPNCVLHIRSVQDDGSGATVTITVEDIANRGSAPFRHEVERLQAELKYIEGQRDFLIDQFMPIFRELVFRGEQTIIGQITHLTMSEGITMTRDANINQEQTGAVGPNAHAHDMTFQQVQNQSNLDLPQLAEELAKLRTAMKQETEGTREQDKAIIVVADAEEAAAKGDGPTALRHLKAAGQWTLGIAEKIGVAVAVEAIKRAM
jgi:uncharacterized protein YjbI with pentapeptide repeats